MAKKPKPTLQFPDGTLVEVDMKDGDAFCVHRPTGSPTKDYVVTRVSDLAVMLRARLKGDATSACKCLCWLSETIGPEETARLVKLLHQNVHYKLD